MIRLFPKKTENASIVRGRRLAQSKIALSLSLILFIIYIVRFAQTQTQLDEERMRILFQYKDNVPFINVRLNGMECRLVIDTGTSHCVIDSGVARQFGLVDTSNVVLRLLTVEGQVNNSPLFISPSMELGGTVLEGVRFVGIDLDQMGLQAEEGPGWHGLLGTDFFKAYDGIINFEESSVSFKVPREAAPSEK